MRYLFIIVCLFLVGNARAQTAQSKAKGTAAAPPQTNIAGVYEHPEKPAYFGPGRDSLDRFIKQHIHVKHAGGGTANAIVVFIVEKDGHVGAAEILRTSNDSDLDAEAVNIAKKMPAWIPAKDHGEVVRSSNMLAISFMVK